MLRGYLTLSTRRLESVSAAKIPRRHIFLAAAASLKTSRDAHVARDRLMRFQSESDLTLLRMA